MNETTIPPDEKVGPLDGCRNIAWVAIKELADLSPNDRPMEVMSVDDALEWLTKHLCRAYIEGQRYVTG